MKAGGDLHLDSQIKFFTITVIYGERGKLAGWFFHVFVLLVIACEPSLFMKSTTHNFVN